MFVELEVKTAMILHGYDTNNQEVIETVNEPDFMRKMISIDRIKSISEKYILVTSSHERLMYWEYKGSIDQLKKLFIKANILLQ